MVNDIRIIWHPVAPNKNKSEAPTHVSFIVLETLLTVFQHSDEDGADVHVLIMTTSTFHTPNRLLPVPSHANVRMLYTTADVAHAPPVNDAYGIVHT